MKRTRQTIKAGMRGTKKLVNKFGENLLYVRYYYDIKKQKKITTVELIIDSKNWEPMKIPPKKIVALKVGPKEFEVQQKIREKGGKWNKGKEAWEIAFEHVKALGLQSRMIY